MTAVLLALKAFGGQAWAFLKTPLGQISALLFAGVLSLATAYAVGHHNGVMKERRAEAARAAKAAAVVARREVVAAKISTDIATRTEQTRVQIQWRTRTLIEKVPDYVQVDPARPSLPVGFVRLHDAATRGLPPAPDAAGRPDGAPSGVTDPQLLTVDIANAGTCHEKDAIILGWQKFYVDLAKAYNVKHGPMSHD